MCLILFSWKQHPEYKLILAANRDEFYERPTKAAEEWEDYTNVIAGRDLQAGGTWLGVSKNGRLAAITNYRDPKNIDPFAKSRGDLTKNFLISDVKPSEYLQELRQESHNYNGFNLLLSDGENLMVYNNVNHELRDLASGTYGLSNGFFQESWPKLDKGRNALEKSVQTNAFDQSDLLNILGNNERAPDESLPITGIPIEWERALSPLFITTESYGTRCSTILYIRNDNNGKFIEKTYPVGGQTENLAEYDF